MEELIAKRYVQALLSIADDRERVVYIQLLNDIAASFGDPKVLVMIQSPIISDNLKVDTILSALGKNSDKKLINFIKILGEKKRLALIPTIAEMLNAQMQKESNAYDGIVKTNKALDAEAITQIEKIISRYTGSSIKLNQVKNDSDGLRVAVDDLGIEVNFSKERVKEQLIDFIMKSH